MLRLSYKPSPQAAVMYLLALLSIETQAQTPDTFSIKADPNAAASISDSDNNPAIDPKLRLMIRQRTQAAESDPAASGFIVTRVVNGLIAIEAMSLSDNEKLMSDLQAAGVESLRQYNNLIVGKIPLAHLKNLEAVRSARFIRPSAGGGSSAGSVTSQGDAAQLSDQARATYAVDGSGVMVGVTSTGYNSLNGEAKDIASGDLPGSANLLGRNKPVVVLKDLPNGTVGDDEGRAMLQIVHDVAPGAELAVYIPDSVYDHAAGLRALAARGAHVISDDLYWYYEPWFQHGPIETAQRELQDNGVLLFNAAANIRDLSAEGVFTPTSARSLTVNGRSQGRWAMHNWGNGQTTFPVTLNRGANITLVLQWDEPYASYTTTGAGAQSDLDLLIFGSSQTNELATSSTTRNINGDPIEIVTAYHNADASADTFTFYVGIGTPSNSNGTPRKFKIVAFSPDSGLITWPDDMRFRSSTIVGHNMSPAVTTACAVRYDEANTSQGPLPTFASSVGGFAYTRDITGAQISSSTTEIKPDLCGPDGVDTTFFGGYDLEGNGYPNFSGTSAASPHLAGVAALMLQASGMNLTPERARQLMQQTATDITNSFDGRATTGLDYKSGAGFINAFQAVNAALLEGR